MGWWYWLVWSVYNFIGAHILYKYSPPIMLTIADRKSFVSPWWLLSSQEKPLNGYWMLWGAGSSQLQLPPLHLGLQFSHHLKSPLMALTKPSNHPFSLSPTAITTFQTLCTAFSSAPILRYPDASRPFVGEANVFDSISAWSRPEAALLQFVSHNFSSVMV